MILVAVDRGPLPLALLGEVSPSPASDIEDQTFSTGQIGRRNFADRYFAEDNPNPMTDVCALSGRAILVRRLSSLNIPRFAGR